MDAVDRQKMEELYREATEENHDFTIDDIVDRIAQEMSRAGDVFDRGAIRSFVEHMHESRAHGHPLDYDDVSEQSFPASDPPPVP